MSFRLQPTRDHRKPLKQVVIADPELEAPWLDDLRQAAFSPTLFSNNYDACQTAIEQSDVHLVLMSLRSPMMDGIPASRLLRQNRAESDVAIVLMVNSPCADEDIVADAFAAGVTDVIRHPFSTSELIARLDVALKRMSQPVAMKERLSSSADTVREGSRLAVEVRQALAAIREHSTPLDETSTTSQIVVPDAVAETEAVEPIAPKSVRAIDHGTNGEEWLLSHDLPHGLRAPRFDSSRLKFVSSVTDRERGRADEVLLDRVWLCPQCHALPSFRPACPCCGSARVERDSLMHHFACAYVGQTSEFCITADDGLACPKCCTQRLIVGTDCESLHGPYRCDDCQWSPQELEIIGHCLKCGLRFPSHQAILEDLVGHHCSESVHADSSVAKRSLNKPAMMKMTAAK